MKILVLSPHSDDAVLSCFDHMRCWIRAGHTVHVCTVFSKFTPSKLSSDAREYMGNSGFDNAGSFATARQAEDRKALAFLGAEYSTPGLVDGAFVLHKGKLVYPTFRKLFSGRISQHDDRVLKLVEYLKKIRTKYDRVISPIGLGSHTDHVIVFQCAQNIFDRDVVSFYYDVPYYFFLYNWAKRYRHTLLRMKISLRWTTGDKIRGLKFYRSQLGLIIRNSRRPFFNEGRMLFPEIVASPW